MSGDVLKFPARVRIGRPKPKPARNDAAPFDLSALAAPINTSGRIADEAIRQIIEAYKLARIGSQDAGHVREWLRQQFNVALSAGEAACEAHKVMGERK